MTYRSIKIQDDRIAVKLSAFKTAQFICWSLMPSEQPDLRQQLELALEFHDTFDGVVGHMRANGYEFELEEIY